MSETRNDGPSLSREDDPFAELFKMIEKQAPSRSRDVAPPSRPSPAGFDEPAADFDHFRGEPTAPRAPLAGAVQRGADGLPARRPFYSDDETSDVGAALIGLCQPAQPRIHGPAETVRIAPDRFPSAEEAPMPVAGSTVMDDFDALIASELAVLKADIGQPAPSYVPYDPAGRYEPAPEAYGQDWAAASQAAAAAVPAAAAQAPTAAAPGRRAGGRHAGGRYPVVGGSRRRRAMFLGGGAAAVALVGLFGAFAGGGFSGGLLGDGEPVLIRADADPVKIAPVDPGGRVIPNQNKAVYQRAAGAAPAQDMLITASEEPLDISFEDEVSDLPGVMVGTTDLPVAGEVQVAQAGAPSTSDGISSILQPHRVRTYEVRPDGTLVPRTEAAPAAPDPVEAVGQGTLPFSVEAPTQAEPPLAAPAAAAPPAETPAASAPVAPVEAPVEAPAVAAQPAPAAPAQPEPAVAAAPPAAPAVSADAFFVQISSQPSEALAQESMQTLSGRYSGAIGGRQLTIQPAEIDGRGTFYRVRVVTASRDEANSVCANLQSAGGSCFVTR